MAYSWFSSPGGTTGVALGTTTPGGATSGICTGIETPLSNVKVTVTQSPGTTASFRPVGGRWRPSPGTRATYDCGGISIEIADAAGAGGAWLGEADGTAEPDADG